MLAYQDCAYRFRGTYDYMMFCDTDDFFVPRIPSEKTFHYYIQHWCHYGACRFHWIERYPDCGLDWNQLGMDGNLTSILKSPTSLRRTDDKSLYKSAIVLDVRIHSPSETMSGYSTIHMPSNVPYFAHIRYAHMPQQGSACVLQFVSWGSWRFASLSCSNPTEVVDSLCRIVCVYIQKPSKLPYTGVLSLSVGT